MGRPQAIFWDMDGTLTDSEPLWEKATYRMAALLGRELTPEVRARTVGASFPETFRICCEWAGFTPAHGDYERYRDDSFEYVAELYQSEDTVFPGVRALLSELQADGVPMFVTTNTARAVAVDVVESIGRSYFVDVICGDDVPVGKPDPAMYLEAARRAGAHPADCLVFEDSATGMRAAVDAGCRTIGLPLDDTVNVPAAAVAMATLRGEDPRARHLNGVTAADLYRWFDELPTP